MKKGNYIWESKDFFILKCSFWYPDYPSKSPRTTSVGICSPNMDLKRPSLSFSSITLQICFQTQKGSQLKLKMFIFFSKSERMSQKASIKICRIKKEEKGAPYPWIGYNFLDGGTAHMWMKTHHRSQKKLTPLFSLEVSHSMWTPENHLYSLCQFI